MTGVPLRPAPRSTEPEPNIIPAMDLTNIRRFHARGLRLFAPALAACPALAVLTLPVVAAEPFAPEGDWYSPRPEAQYHYFGIAVAVSGDTMVVGAPGDPGSASGVNGDTGSVDAPWSGAAYIFRRRDGAWMPEAYLKPHRTAPDDNFGSSVAISGDTVVIGAPFEDGGAGGVNNFDEGAVLYNSGAAYVFVRQDGVWSQQAYLKASNLDDADQFGTSVAISGDVIAVGAPGEDSGSTGVSTPGDDNSAEDSGAVYVFRRTGGTWTESAFLKAGHADSGDDFGRTVALGPDPQGEPDDLILAAGAINEGGATGDPANNDAPKAGAAWVFEFREGGWEGTAYLKAAEPAARTWWADTVSVGGGLIAVGCTEAANLLRVFRRAEGGGWAADSAIPSGKGRVALSGSGLLAAADINGGVIRVLTRENGTWQPLQDPITVPKFSDVFGYGVALDGGTLIVSAPSAKGPTDISGVGHVAVFRQPEPQAPADLRINQLTAVPDGGSGIAIRIAGSGAHPGAELALFETGTLEAGEWQLVATAPADAAGAFTFGPFTGPAGAGSRFYRIRHP